jgi:hydroxymethylbilane synthase
VQSGWVAEKLRQVSGREVELVLIKAEGDDTSMPFSAATRPGIFVSTLRDALLASEVDFIVHSFKDLPSGLIEGITLAAVPEREDWRDVLVSASGATLAELPAGTVVGTSSPRRAARVRALRPDLVVEPIRGNVDTRLSKVAGGEFGATVLAAAGLNRLSRSNEITQFFTADEMLPAPAQGSLAVECRTEDRDLLILLCELNSQVARFLAIAERAELRGVNASCTTAIGALATWEDGVLEVVAELSHPALDWHERVSIAAPVESAEMLNEAHQLGMFAAGKLMATSLGSAIQDL